MLIDYGKRTQNENKDVTEDNITVEEFTSGKVEEYETYRILSDFIYQVLNVNEKNKSNLMSIMENLIDIENEEEFEEALEFVGYKIVTLLDYLGVSVSAINDLLDDDEDISESEMISLAEMLASKVDGDIRKFVVKTLNEVTEDDITMDNTFYANSAECKNGKGENKVPKKSTLKCVVGYSGKDKGYWRIPKDADKRKNSDDKATSSQKSHLKTLHTKMHSSKADAKRIQAMSARSKSGMPVFGGYSTAGSKKQKTKNI